MIFCLSSYFRFWYSIKYVEKYYESFKVIVECIKLWEWKINFLFKKKVEFLDASFQSESTFYLEIIIFYVFNSLLSNLNIKWSDFGGSWIKNACWLILYAEKTLLWRLNTLSTLLTYPNANIYVPFIIGTFLQFLGWNKIHELLYWIRSIQLKRIVITQNLL